MGITMQIELIPRRPYGSGRVDAVCGPRRRLFPALGGPSWSRLCPLGVRVLVVPFIARHRGASRPEGASHTFRNVSF